MARYTAYPLDFIELWQDAGYEPLSAAGRRIVTCHNDIHVGNIIVKPDLTAHMIDFEDTCPS